MLAGDYLYVGSMLQEQEDEVTSKYIKLLSQLTDLAKAEAPELAVKASLLKGKISAGDQIVEYCKETNADMLVLASRDLSALKRYFVLLAVTELYGCTGSGQEVFRISVCIMFNVQWWW